MRANCMSLNRLDVQHAVTEKWPVSWQSRTREHGSCSSVGHGRLVQVISEQRYVKALRVDTDSDYVGCVLTRKSTTCAHLFHGVNLINPGSWTQGTRSLSVAAKSMIMERRGAGRIRHLHCPVLRLQERFDSGELRIEKRKGEDNTADIGTKAVTAPVLLKHLKTLRMEWRVGRHPLTSECCTLTLI